MYKTECSQCKKIYETEVKYYNFVCGECTRKNKEEEAERAAHQKEREGTRRGALSLCRV